jgi:predicted small secreted protein
VIEAEETPMTAQLPLTLTLLLLAATLAGCANTARGVAADVENNGRAVERAVK